MPQAIPIAAAIAVYGMHPLVQLAVYAAASYVSGEIMKRDVKVPRPAGREVMVNNRSTGEFLPIVYGECRVGGNDVFIESDDDDLWVVQTLSEGECDSIKQVDSVDQVFLGEKLASEYSSSYLSYTFYSGTSSQAVDTDLNSAVSKWTDTQHYVCYLVWKLTLNNKLYQGLPLRTLVLKGRKLYDFRDGTTAYSANPVLELYDYMTNSDYGINYNSSNIDTDSWTDCANYCDTKGWECHIVIKGDYTASRVIDLICSHFRGHLLNYGGKLYLVYSDLNDESSVMTITDDGIVQDQNGKALVSISQPGLFGKPDGLRVVYTDVDRNYLQNEIYVGESSGIIEDLELLGCQDKKQAADLGVYFLERRQTDRVITLSLRDSAIKLVPHDIVTLTTSALSISNQKMRVFRTSLNPNGWQEVSLMWESLSLYNDEYDIELDDVYECTLPDPKADPSQVTNVTFTEEEYELKDRTYNRVKITWEAPSYYPWIEFVEVWVSSDNVTFIHYSTGVDSSYFGPIEKGEVWYIKLVPVSIWGSKLTLTETTTWTHNVTGKTTGPDDVTGFHVLVAGDMLHLKWNAVTNKDIVGYDIRYGSSWIQSLPLFLINATSKVIVGMKPGTHTLQIKAKDALDVYSTNAASATFKVLTPPMYVLNEYHQTDDFTGGTHYDTERYNDPTYGWVLRVDRGVDDNLSGYWESAQIDLGSSLKKRWWALFAFALAPASSLTWNWLFEGDATKTWNDVLEAGETWAEAFQANQAAGDMYMKLMWSDNGSDWSEADYFEILSMEVEARYIKYRVYLEDSEPDARVMIDGDVDLYGYYWE